MGKGKTKEAPSLSSEHETSASVKHDYTALEIAEACVTQYYTFLQASPEDAYKFYHKERNHPLQCTDCSMKLVTTMEDIGCEISFSNIKEWNPNLSTMHAQYSVLNSVIVGLTGSITDTDDVTRNFAETFLLSRLASGSYYVHNHFLQFIEVNNISESSPYLDAGAPKSSILGTPKSSFLGAPKSAKFLGTPKSSILGAPKSAKFFGTPKSSILGTPKSSFLCAPKSSILGTPKSSFLAAPRLRTPRLSLNVLGPLSSVLGAPKSPVLGASRLSVIVHGAPKSSVLGAPKSSVLSAPNSSVLGAPKSSVLPVKASTFPYNSPPENINDVKAIRVKDLPPKVTQELLLEVVKKFGAVKQKDIQIKGYSQDGYRYAFVEFDNSKSARNAVEARFIQFEDRECEIQYKRTYNQGGNNNRMGRP